MSGGSWNYAYFTFSEVADQLIRSKCALRRSLGRKIKLVSEALHDIEWVDSGDMSSPDEEPAIKKALGKEWKAAVVRELIDEAKDVYKRLGEAIARSD